MPTVYVTLPNTGTASIDLIQVFVNNPGSLCVTASIANYCYGFATGSFGTFFNGNVSGSYGNVAVSASAQKDDCTGPACFTASFYTTVVPADTYFSTTSQADANNQAIAYLTSVSQSNANTFGSCSYNARYSTEISASVQKNDCLVCGTGSIVNVILPASYSMTFCDQTDAQTDAQLYFNANSQSWANASGSCSYWTYYSTAISASVQKNDCGAYGTGSFSLISIPTSQSFDSCSQANAQTKAQNYFNSISQSQANSSGSCTFRNTEITGSIAKNDCTGSGWFDITSSIVSYIVSASVFSSSVSYADAQASASAYWTSSAQANANASGSCSYNLIQTIQYGVSADAISQSSYPLTASAFSTGSTSFLVYNGVNDSSPLWKVIGYISTSISTGSNTGFGLPYQSFKVTSSFSGSQSTTFFKVRGANGEFIRQIGSPYSKDDQLSTNAGTITPFAYRPSFASSTASLQVLVVPHMINNLTQSVAVSQSAQVYMTQAATGFLTGSSAYLTASYIYTASTAYPTVGDAKWKVIGRISGSAGSEFEPLVIKSGSIRNVPSTPVYADTSTGSYFFKFVDGSGTLIPVSSSTSTTDANLNATASVSGGLLRFTYTISGPANPTAVNYFAKITLRKG